MWMVYLAVYMHGAQRKFVASLFVGLAGVREGKNDGQYI